MDNLCKNRTHNNGELTIKDVGKVVELKGWCAKKRNLGSLVFIDIRDKYGITQLRCDEKVSDISSQIKTEYVIYAKGVVVERESKNLNIPTGEIEIAVSELKIINTAELPPIYISDDKDAVSENVRLKYRYLDLRRKSMQDILKLRHKVTKCVREYLDNLDFTEVETPILGKSTPEGARDYLVPSRIHNGSFYALPQSPQIFKQLLMVSGLERYYQIARCFRDEDLRADRQPEFTQIDIEVSFIDLDTLYGILEGMFRKIFKDIKGIDDLSFPKMTWKEVMDQYGSDKPDIRYEMKLTDISSLFVDSPFDFLKGKVVKAIVAKKAAMSFTRKEIDQLADLAKLFKAKGLCWCKVKNGELEGASAKLVIDKVAFKEALNYEDDDLILFVADDWLTAVTALGQVRIAIAKKLNLAKADEYKFLWVTEFPMYEYTDDGQLQAMHHPFTAYIESDEKYIQDEPLKVRSNAYDLVLNGYELGSGSVRIYNQEMQRKVFERIGLSDDDINKKFGFFVEALKYGTPPHLGMGFGLERIVMILAGTNNIRDVVAFPKIQSASDLMNDCPSEVEESALDLLGIKVVNKENDVNERKENDNER
ncbi:MAG: aspartate--tRNA ligase [Erysipelotrichaceae bacterium]|nr:aspartate--tRNA ligase [Erysipelotrichaceae bacterium]